MVILVDTQLVSFWPVGAFPSGLLSPSMGLVVSDGRLASRCDTAHQASLVRILPLARSKPVLQRPLFVFSWKWYM